MEEINRNCDYGLRFYLHRDSFLPFDPALTSDNGEKYVLLSSGGDMRLNDAGIVHRKIVARFLPYCWVEFLAPNPKP